MNNTFTLANGVEMPQIGYGTLHIPDNREGIETIKLAISAGYRHIDTAAKYGNEAAVGAAVRECGIPRDQMFVTSKLDNTQRGYDTTIKDFERALSVMGLDYLDLYLIHWPAGAFHYPDWEQINSDTWRALEKLYNDGKVRAIGVSNFWPHHLRSLTDNCETEPMVNQIKFQPGFLQPEVFRYSKFTGMQVEAYSPLGSGQLLSSPELSAVAEKYGKSTAQLCIRWCLQHGVSPLPRSTNMDRMQQNLDVYDFEITEKDMKAIDDISNEAADFMRDPDKLDLK